MRRSLLSFVMLFNAVLLFATDPEKPVKKAVDSTSQKFCYLKVAKQDVLEGDTFVYSSVVAVDAKLWDAAQDQLVAHFEQALEQQYPGVIFDLSYESVSAAHTTAEKATQAQRSHMVQQMKQQVATQLVHLAIVPAN